MKPLRTGISLALTVTLFYAACTVVWILLPEPFITFMNSLFHGLDFRKLGTPAGLTWPSFLEAIVVLALWAFAAGAVFSWISRALWRGERSTSH